MTNAKETQTRLERACSGGGSQLTWYATCELDALASAPRPRVGTVRWTPAPSYASWMQDNGPFALDWYSTCQNDTLSLELLRPAGIREMSEVVYLPGGVSMGDGVLTTNHLVPFARVGGEATFCFDVSVDGAEHPVYYHHQDAPRARIEETGEWHPSTREEPDFANFDAWIGWLLARLESDWDPDGLGQPRVGFGAEQS